MWRVLLLVLGPAILAMRYDPERIAARMRIDAKYDAEELQAKYRSRRQSIPAKEISIQVTAPLFSSRLFEYGKEVNDSEVPTALDVGKKVDLSPPIKFYGKEYSTIYILSNGGIGFEQSARSYKPGILPSNIKMIAPYWNRNDLRLGGHVYYRIVKKGRVLERGASEINYQYGQRVRVHMALVVTWENMQPLLPDKSTPLPLNNTNIFQAAIFATDNGTYANYIFSSVGWTQGAESGFNKGDGKEHFALPTSGTGNIMYLEEQGNTGIPGEWMFEISGEKVVRCKVGWKGDTCDQQCSKDEWGADCESCCHCANGGKCDALTGECQGGIGCSDCWTGPFCQTKKENCKNRSLTTCAANAISFTDYDRCGEPVPRCQCLSGFTGDGQKSCHDIDECHQPGICHRDAACVNTPGRYFCQCKAGFQGDGVKSCSAAFLYPSDGHQQLPKSKNSKVTWQLKNPLKIMGKNADKLTISTSGLITLGEIVESTVSQLDDIHVPSIAPFFGQIDISHKGQVTVAESQDPELLTRSKRLIEDQYGEQFEPRSIVTVTYTNVSDGNGPKGNTFQTVFTGGVNAQKQAVTYVQLLYKDMPWGDNAEAGIMTNDLQTSLVLPGSGTSLANLPSSSNIKQPGVWLFRIDEKTIAQCPKESQLPPYCDQVRVDARAKEIQSNLDKHLESLAIRPGQVEVGAPKQIVPTLDNSPPSRSRIAQSTARPRPVFGNSTPHKPLVSLGPEDFNVDPDVFEAVTFPPFQTVQPQLATEGSTATAAKKLPDFTVTQVPLTTPTTPPPPPSTTREPPIEQTFPTFALEEEEAVASVNENLKKTAPEVVNLPESVPILPSTVITEDLEEDLNSGKVEEITAPPSETPKLPIFIFSSSTKAPSTTRKPSPPPPVKRPANIVTARTTTESSEYDHTPGLAVIVPSVIVLIWIALIALIFAVVCCKRRSSSSRAHNIYGATYGIRPIGYQFKRGSKHLDGSYEDHLEKAARLSTEAYSQPSRLSLYGSYWNLNNSSSSPSGSGPSHRQSPPFNPTRYTYTGRY